MATKKAAAEIPTAKNVYPGEELVKVRIPLVKGEQNYTDVYINARSWRIKHGETVMVPACVAEVLENAEEMLKESMAFIEENSNSDI